MTTSTEEAATTILVSCKQTRFHIENPVYQEVGPYSLTVELNSDLIEA